MSRYEEMLSAYLDGELPIPVLNCQSETAISLLAKAASRWVPTGTIARALLPTAPRSRDASRPAMLSASAAAMAGSPRPGSGHSRARSAGETPLILTNFGTAGAS